MADADHSTKLCCACKRELPLQDFYADKRGRLGLQSKCKLCTKDAGKRFREANPDYRKNYHAENREKLLAQNAAYYSANREREHAKKKAHRLANAEYHQQYREVHKDEKAGYQRTRNKLGLNSALQRNRRANDPGKFRAYESNRRARELAAGGNMSKDILSRLMRLQKERCACCGADLRKTGHHLDHVIPLVRGGSNADENIQLLCPTCNQSKGAKDPIAFMQSRGLLI